MKVKCEYCGNFIQDTDAVCPNCGAPNAHMQRSASGVPKTIAELQKFCAAKNLPLAKMRFLIGQDYKQPKAFGIYQDEDGLFVVYKNKADGSRAIRYRGTDEAYAVNEIYQKLKTEIANQRSLNGGGTRRSGKKRKSTGILRIILTYFLIIVLVTGVQSCMRRNRPQNGYYSYNGDYYYTQNGSWYTYDTDYDYWIPTEVDDELWSNYSDYYESSSYSSSYGIEDFSDSGYYVEPDYSSDWDDDDDWDWGSDDWDSGGSDWDSDW